MRLLEELIMYSKNYNYVLLVISPFAAIFNVIKIGDWAYIKRVGLIVSFIYGFTLNYGNGEDIERHVQMVESFYSEMTLMEFLNYTYYMLTFQFQKTELLRGDLYIHALSFLTGRIIRDARFFTGLAAAIYGYFYLASLEQIFSSKLSQRNSIIIVAITVFFISQRFIDNFQTIRTWTGLWILTYGSIRYFKGHGKKYLLYMFSAPLVHLGYFLMALPVYAMLVLKKMPPLFFVSICLLSFFVNSESFGLIEKIKRNDAAQERAGYYFVSKGETFERLSRLLENTNIYKKLSNSSQKISTYIVIASLTLFGYYRKASMNDIEYIFMGSCLLSIALSNVAVTIYAVHNRTLVIASLFAFLVLVSLIRRGVFRINGNTLSSVMNRLAVILCLFTGIPYFLFVVSNNLNFASWGVLFIPIVPMTSSEFGSSIKDILIFFL